jgi:hypothetical protein
MPSKNTSHPATLPPENLAVFGRCLSMVYRPAPTAGFDDLIAALDRADRASARQRETQTSV